MDLRHVADELDGKAAFTPYPDRPSISASSDRSSMLFSRRQIRSHPSLNAEPPGPDDFTSKEIAPFEASICERLTREIQDTAASLAPAQSTTSSTSSLAASQSLSGVLEQSSLLIQFHARWFAPDPLATLLKTALTAASNSSYTADLHSALHLVEVIATYSLLPCLQPVVRFVSYVYYQGSRSNRHKKLKEFAWVVAQQILDSHLGGQFAGALLDIISEHSGPPIRTNVASTIGALMITSYQLLPDQSAQLQTHVMPPTSLLISLKSASVDGSQVLSEQVSAMLGAMLMDDGIINQLDRDASLGLCLALIKFHATSQIPSEVKELVFKGLEARYDRFEPRHQSAIAELFLEAERPLSPVMMSQMKRLWQRPLLTDEIDAWTREHAATLRKLSDCPSYRTELEAYLDVSILAFFQSRDSVVQMNFLATLEMLILHPATAAPAGEILAAGLVRIFTTSSQSCHNETVRSRLFHLLCDVARHFAVAAKTLLRIRADASGDGYLESEQIHNFSSVSDNSPRDAIFRGLHSLPIQSWINTIAVILDDDQQKWEIYNLMLTQLASQLQNHALWRDTPDYINTLRRVLCDKLNKDIFMEPPHETGLTKSYIASQLIQILTTVVSYHNQLSPNDIKTTIITFINVAGSRDFTVSIHCIHALTICCHERPEVMAGFMDAIINKMSKMVTQRYLAIYVLEFLAGLSRLPTLYDMLRPDDFKRIFGVCHSYLQSIRLTPTLDRRHTPTSDRSTIMSSTSVDDMAPYVHALAHHVMAFWYMALKQPDRDALKEYITGCLTFQDLDGEENIEDQGLVTIDMMDRVDAEEQIDVPLDDDGFSSQDGRILTRHRINGLLLITTQTALRTGKTLVTTRRPSGTTQRVIDKGRRRQNEEARDSGAVFTASITLESDKNNSISVFPDDLSGRTYGKVALPRPSSALGSLDTIVLPENDDSVRRAIESFDRTSALDSHKAGVIYIGEGQTLEHDIFLNRAGSPDYREFLEDLGSLRKLRGAKFNSQGLDCVGDNDGEYTLVWNNDVTEMVYHITTFMPNGPDDRETVINKKKHTGNDFVNIIFNSSGTEFNFDTFPSDFNYVYIIISPAERTSFVQARTITSRNDKHDRFYNVHVVTRPGYPSLSSSGETKVISGTCLGGYVRNQALNACVFSAMWTIGNEIGEYPSSWRMRLQMIRRLYNQHKPKMAHI